MLEEKVKGFEPDHSQILATEWLKTARQRRIDAEEGSPYKTIRAVIKEQRPLLMASLLCANYIGQTVSQELVIGEKATRQHMRSTCKQNPLKGIRRGYMALCEEIPAILSHTSKCAEVKWVPILVDLGSMALPPLDPENLSLELPKDTDQEIEQNKTIMDQLIGIGWQNYSLPGQPAEIIRLSRIGREIDFIATLKESCRLVNHTYQENRNSPLGHLLTQAIKENYDYMTHHWRIKNPKTIRAYTLCNFFALTHAVGIALPRMAEAISGEHVNSREGLILLDVIPGPANKGHKEFRMYNFDQQEALPITRIVHNRVLFSEPATPTPWVEKTAEKLKMEATKISKSISG